MRILLRCDGGPGIGVGHVVRCLSIAELAVQQGHHVELLGRVEGDFLHELAEGVGPELSLLGPATDESAEGVAAAARGCDVIHVDHYEMEPGLLDVLTAEVRGAGDRPLLSNVADGSFGARPADVLVDPTVGAERVPSPSRAAWDLRGSRFAPMRTAVTLRAGSQASVGERPVVLVVMGGADPARCAPLVLDALRATGLCLDVTVVATAETVDVLTDRSRSWDRGRLVVSEPVADLPAAMAAADLVVTAAGTSVWELCALRRPMAAVAVVENQLPGYEAVVGAGAAVGLGRPKDLEDTAATAALLRPVLTDASARDRLARAAGALVDGLGAWRIVRSWEEIRQGARAASDGDATDVAAQRLTVREATFADAELLWQWRNDPATRANSRSHDLVPFESHLTWLKASLARDDRHLLVVSDEAGPVGTLRWDADGRGEWEVSLTVAPERRGERRAGPLLRAGEVWLRSAGAGEGHGDARPTAYLASVHVSNVASRRLFLASGYLPDLPADEEGFERFVKWVRPGPR